MASDEQLAAKRDELMARDSKQVDALKAYNVLLDKKRQIDLTFWAPSEQAALPFADACRRNDMPWHTVLGPGANERNQRWLVRCPMLASVDFAIAKENVVTFLLFADAYDCEYDGWGTAVVEALEKGSPA